MLFFSEMPVLIVPTAVLLVITLGRVYTIVVERIVDHPQLSNSDLKRPDIRHA